MCKPSVDAMWFMHFPTCLLALAVKLLDFTFSFYSFSFLHFVKQDSTMLLHHSDKCAETLDIDLSFGGSVRQKDSVTLHISWTVLM